MDYRYGLCPVAERVEAQQMVLTEFMRPPATRADMDDVIAAFDKVYRNRHTLAGDNRP